jgi:hypothetical protein
MEKFSVLERKLFQSLRAEAGLQSGAEKRRSAELFFLFFFYTLGRP